MKISKKVVFLTLLIVGFSVSVVYGAGGQSRKSSPADGARGFFMAVFTGEGDPISFVCAGAPPELTAAFDRMKAALAIGGSEIDVSGMTFITTSQSGDVAQVAIAGKIKVTIAGQSVDYPFPYLPIPMKKENGVWKVCG